MWHLSEIKTEEERVFYQSLSQFGLLKIEYNTPLPSSLTFIRVKPPPHTLPFSFLEKWVGYEACSPNQMVPILIWGLQEGTGLR